MQSKVDTQLHNSWVLWYHKIHHNWSPSSFEKLFVVKSLDEYFTMITCLKKNTHFFNEHFFFMKDGILPLWEDPINRKGGCWSFKIDVKDSYKYFTCVSMHLIGNNIMYDNNTNISNQISGMSFSPKNNYNTIIQIWNTDAKNSDTKYIQDDVRELCGYDIIYRIHDPEYDIE